MSIYIINICLVLFYMIISKFSTFNKKHITYVFMGIITFQLILILGCRGLNIGTDMTNYMNYYDKQYRMDIDGLDFSRFEIGFKILTKVLSDIYYNKTFYIIILAIISIIPISKIAKKYSSNPFMTIFVYICLGFYTFNFSGLRQAIAIAIIFYSYKYIVEKKMVKYVIAVIAACLFHQSAIVFLPAYFISKIKLNKFLILSVAILDVIIYIFKDIIFLQVNKYFYDDYTMVLTDSYLWMLMCLCIVAACLIVYKSAVKDNELNKGLYILVLAGASLMLFAPIANNIMRVANYYFIFIIILIPNILKIFKNNKTAFAVNCVVIVLCFSIYLFLLNTDGYNTVPYLFTEWR